MSDEYILKSLCGKDDAIRGELFKRLQSLADAVWSCCEGVIDDSWLAQAHYDARRTLLKAKKEDAPCS